LASPLDVLKSVREWTRAHGLCIDVGHTVRAGTGRGAGDPAGGPRVFDVHMKDLANFTDKEAR